METPQRDAAFVQTMTPPRKVDNETMMESVLLRDLQSDVIADVERPQTPPKSIHSNVILDLEKMKTPPRKSMSLQTMTPPGNVDHETMNAMTQAREIHTDFVAFVARLDGPLHATNATQTVATVFDAIASQTDDPERHDNGKMTAGKTD